MDLVTIFNIATAVIAGASIILGAIAPLTKSKRDDRALAFLKKVLKILSLHVKEDNVVEVKVSSK